MSRYSLLLNVLELMTARWKGYRDSVQTRREIDLLTPDEVDGLASDCGLTPGQFRNAVRRGPHAADELGSVMKALGIDVEKLRSRDRATYNDMRLVCSECRRKPICLSIGAEC